LEININLSDFDVRAASKDEINLTNENPKISVNSEPIHIDGDNPSSNWMVAKNAGICTGNGSYSEPYVIKDLIINGGGVGSCILIENSFVYLKIENCSVSNSGQNYPDAGIQLSDVSNALIIDNNCSSNLGGIRFFGGSNNTISKNFADNNYNGLTINYSNGTKILENNLISNNYGIVFSPECNNNNVSRNIVNNNYIGIIIDYQCDNNDIVGNIVNANFYAGIMLWQSDNNKILGNTINYNGWAGIEQNYCLYNIISGNNISRNNQNGMLLYNCEFNNISGNNIKNNANYGMKFRSSNNNTLTQNNVSYNKYSGFKLCYCEDNLIEGNIIFNNDIGIYLFESRYNEISNNTFLGNNQDIKITNPIYDEKFEALKPLLSLILTLLSIATILIFVIFLTVQLITKPGYYKRREVYYFPYFGFLAIIIESTGVLLFIINAISLNSREYLIYCFLILTPFSLAGIKVSFIGLKRDAKIFSARVGIILGATLRILCWTFLVLYNSSAPEVHIFPPC